MAQTKITREFLPWLKVLNEYCAQDLVTEYNGFDSGRKVKLLEAIRSAVLVNYKELRREFISGHYSSDLQKNMTDMLSKYGVDAESALITHKTLAKAIQDNESSKIYPVNLKTITDLLASWGSFRLNELAIFIHQRYIKEQESNNPNYTHKSHDSAVIKEDQRINTDFNRLSKIPLADLKLFSTAEGKFVEGVIITDPLVIVGITTFIRDEQGSHIQVALYNMLPSDPNLKQTVAESKFKPGTVVRIAEPFYKIFRDGKRGIRVDSPNELQILPGGFTGESKTFFDLNAIKEEGRKAFKDKNYIEALEVYLEALHHFPEVCVLLNNRSQCEIELKEYEVALLDAAAVLFLEESNLKGKKRYDFAAKRLGFQKHRSQELWRKVLSGDHHRPPTEEVCVHGTKEKGNDFFKARKFKDAQSQYTSALSDSDVCYLLNNIAVVCLKLEMYQTAISAASASMRIACVNVGFRKKAKFAMTKAFSMVGEFEFAKFSGKGDKTLVKFGEEPMALGELCNAIFIGANEAEKGNFELKENLPNDFIQRNAIEHRYVDGKGRGLVAARDILPNELLMIDRSIHYESNNEMLLLNYSKKEVDVNGKLELCSDLLNIAKHDGLLVKKLLLLEHRRAVIDQNSDEQLPLIDDLHWMGYRAISFLIPPFLPQTPLQVGVDSGLFTFKRVESVLKTNVFAFKKRDHIINKITTLMLRVSLFNHRSPPNCIHMCSGNAMAIFSREHIRKGEELFIDYGEGYGKQVDSW